MLCSPELQEQAARVAMYGFTLAVHVTFPQFPHFMILRFTSFFLATFGLCRVGKPSQGTHEMRTELLWSSISTSHLANSKPTRSQPKDPKVQRCPEMSRDVQRCPDPEEIDPQKSKHSGIAKSSTMCSFCSGFSSNVEL